MGPRSDGRGQPIAARTLQWGRDLTVADSQPAEEVARPGRGRRSELLQWGRDLTVADSWRRHSVSMGRGQIGASMALQWGRDLTVADRAYALAALESTLRRLNASVPKRKLIFETSIGRPPCRRRLVHGSASAPMGPDVALLLAASIASRRLGTPPVLPATSWQVGGLVFPVVCDS